MADDVDLTLISPRDAEQIRRARLLLGSAVTAGNFDAQFVLEVAALHLARAIPEYWYTTAQQIPMRLNKEGKEGAELSRRLLAEFEEVFSVARRYDLLTELRRWDFHWEPLRNPATVEPNCTYGRGAPVRLSTGPNANSSAALIGGHQLFTAGSGRRVGRSNYYQIHQNRFVDFGVSEAVPLALAVGEFLDDLPSCIAKLLEKPDVIAYRKTFE